jgi:hypothetical protein
MAVGASVETFTEMLSVICKALSAGIADDKVVPNAALKAT